MKNHNRKNGNHDHEKDDSGNGERQRQHKKPEKIPVNLHPKDPEECLASLCELGHAINVIGRNLNNEERVAKDPSWAAKAEEALEIKEVQYNHLERKWQWFMVIEWRKNLAGREGGVYELFYKTVLDMFDQQDIDEIIEEMKRRDPEVSNMIEKMNSSAFGIDEEE